MHCVKVAHKYKARVEQTVKLAEDANQTEEKKVEAASPSKKMDKFEFVILTRNCVLNRYRPNEVSKTVHAETGCQIERGNFSAEFTLSFHIPVA